jgi:hypothetical protein
MNSKPWYIRRKPCTYLVLRLTLSPNGVKQASTWHTLRRSTIRCAQNNFHARGTFSANRASFLRRDLKNLQTDRNELLLDPCHLGVQSSASKIISEPMVRSAQTMHLSCIEINTISKWTRASFHFNPRHLGVASAAPKIFLNLWFVRCRPCIYFASRLTLSPNRLKRSSTWSTPPSSTIWCAQSNFRPCGTFEANRAPVLPRD